MIPNQLYPSLTILYISTKIYKSIALNYMSIICIKSQTSSEVWMSFRRISKVFDVYRTRKDRTFAFLRFKLNPGETSKLCGYKKKWELVSSKVYANVFKINMRTTIHKHFKKLKFNFYIQYLKKFPECIFSETSLAMKYKGNYFRTYLFWKAAEIYVYNKRQYGLEK